MKFFAVPVFGTFALVAVEVVATIARGSVPVWRHLVWIGLVAMWVFTAWTASRTAQRWRRLYERGWKP